MRGAVAGASPSGARLLALGSHRLGADGLGVAFQAEAPAGAVRRSRQPVGGQQPRTAEHESDAMP